MEGNTKREFQLTCAKGSRVQQSNTSEVKKIIGLRSGGRKRRRRGNKEIKEEEEEEKQ